MAVVSVWVAVVAAWLPRMFLSDSWLALVDGRYVAGHGLPHRDTLTAWTYGVRWIDQQWGAQVLLYEASRLGLSGPAAVAIVCIAAALALAAVAARRLGASARSTAVGAMIPVLGAPWLAQVRTQTLVLPLFVLVFALLRSNRYALVALPVLAIWANLHGSVSLAAGLTALYGVTIVRRRRRTGIALLAAPLTLLLSPYGLDLVGYYRAMLLDPPLAHVVAEWQPMRVSVATAPFFVSAFGFAVLCARHRRVMTGFEQLATILLLVAALVAVRNAVWFELALAVVLPRLLDAERPPAPAGKGVRRLNAFLGVGAATVALAVVGGSLAHPSSWFDHAGTPAAAAAVSRAAGSHRVVLADDLHADWLLWERPELAGRVAYDVRFELLTRRQLAKIVALEHRGRGDRRRYARRSGEVSFDPR